MNWLVLIIAKKLFFVGICGYFPNSFGVRSAGIILLLTDSFVKEMIKTSSKIHVVNIVESYEISHLYIASRFYRSFGILR